MTAHRFDALTAEHMRAGGSWKWSTPGESHGRGLIGAFVAEMDYPVAEAVADAVRASADGSRFGYLPDGWVADMAAACSAYWGDRFGWAPDPAWVRPVPDVLTAFTATVRHFTRPGSPILLPTPAYMPFLTVPGMIDRELVQVPMARSGGRFVLDLDAIDRGFADGAGLLVLTTPHNPTGRVFDAAELAAVAEVVERHGARVFSDEIHAPLTFGDARHRPYVTTSAAAPEHTVTATSASKAWNLPGLKAGQVLLSNAADAQHWTANGYLAEHGTATPGVLASTAAYRDARGWLDDVLAYLEGNRALLAGADLPGIDVTVPDGTYLAWLDARGLGLDEPPSAFFTREAGVVMTDGAACGEAGRGGMRLNLAMSRPVLTDSLARIRSAVWSM
ncbi:aminotransferase class I/II-fold pyridoxal phosphate-dependent enzyme [Actinomycetospora lutea]|uniref:MalY/PatB family protein n=1 Tax=Actinomycetospora lutea TaxID=663604 RepID=UPI002366CCCD|nr:aminotransferase class I/II-fold pyridoxal phosphate-dependent enzyme [Actinomycetospora lutea]MDD7937073.1 aminotransferase class I/II-fold pyridoxal phosphate-dependent enzyme [Actinomycetospora lutea]